MTRATQITVALACLGAAATAHAHFKLEQPASWAVQDGDGNPQKAGPCGNEGAVETGRVVEYKVGENIPIIISETVYHPGHYRVSLARDQASLPDDPPVTVGATECGSVAITTNPTMPLLADGLLVHNQRFNGRQTMMVALPPGMTCDSCVLQIVEFMSNHDAPCFYHHCSNIKITVNGADAGVPGGDAGSEGGTGGGCSTGAPSLGAGLVIAALGLVLVLRRRQRR